MASVAFAVIIYAMLPNFAFGNSRAPATNPSRAAASDGQMFYAYSSYYAYSSGAYSSGFFASQSGKIIFDSSSAAANIKTAGSGVAPDVQDTYFSFGAGAQQLTGNLAQKTFDLNKVLNAGEQPVIVTNQNGQWSFAAPDYGTVTAVSMASLSDQQIFVRVYQQQSQQITSYAFNQGTQFPESGIFETSSRAVADMAGSGAIAAAMLLVLLVFTKMQTQTLMSTTNKFQVLRC